MCEYYPGGKDNFAADRELAERLTAIAPAIVDFGCGMPTAPSTHESARAVKPGARVAYADNDPVVLSHLDALTVHDTGMVTVPGDITDPDTCSSASPA